MPRPCVERDGKLNRSALLRRAAGAAALALLPACGQTSKEKTAPFLKPYIKVFPAPPEDFSDNNGDGGRGLNLELFVSSDNPQPHVVFTDPSRREDGTVTFTLEKDGVGIEVLSPHIRGKVVTQINKWDEIEIRIPQLFGDMVNVLDFLVIGYEESKLVVIDKFVNPRKNKLGV